MELATTETLAETTIVVSVGRQLAKAQTDGRLEARLTHFAKPKLLIIDELGYLPLEPNAAAHCSSSWSAGAMNAVRC